MDREKVIRELKAARLFFEMGSNRAGGVVGNLGCKCGKGYIDDALELLKEQEEIVRCKDCKHRQRSKTAIIDGQVGFWCEMTNAYRPDGWFCADGERR